MSEPAENSMETELEVLKEIYINELTSTRKDDGTIEKLELLLHPATGHDTTKQYVCMTVVFTPSSKYPLEPPGIEIRNPRGLGEEEVRSLEEDMKVKAKECVGEVMLFELIEMAKDSLTEGNIPHCPCVVCLEHFHEHDSFHRTACYHYFHKRCLQNYLKHTQAQIEEEKKEAEELRHHDKNNTDQLKAIICPVCRAVLDEESLTVECEEEEEKEEEIEEEFHLSPELKEQQRKMAEIYQRQKANGGIIDLEQEKNKYLVNPEDRLPIRSLTPTITEKSSTATESGRNSSKSPRKVENRDLYDRREARGRGTDSGYDRRGGRGGRGRMEGAQHGHYRNRNNRTRGERGYREDESKSFHTDDGEKVNSQRESDVKSAEKLSETCEADLYDGERSSRGRGGFNRGERGGRDEGGPRRGRGGRDRGQRGRDGHQRDSGFRDGRDGNYRSGRGHNYQGREDHKVSVEEDLSDKTQVYEKNSGKNSGETHRQYTGKEERTFRHSERGGGNFRHSERGGGNFRHSERGGGNFRHSERGGGNFRHSEREGGTYRHNEREGGTYRHNERGGGSNRGRGRRDEHREDRREGQEKGWRFDCDDEHPRYNDRDHKVEQEERKETVPLENNGNGSVGASHQRGTDSDDRDRAGDNRKFSGGTRAAWRGSGHKDRYVEKKVAAGGEDERNRDGRPDSGRKDWKGNEGAEERHGHYGKSQGRYEKPRNQQQGYHQQQHQQRYQGNRQNERRERRDRPNDRRDGQNRQVANEYHQGESHQNRGATGTDVCVENEAQDDEKTDLQILKYKGRHRSLNADKYCRDSKIELTPQESGYSFGQRPAMLYGSGALCVNDGKKYNGAEMETYYPGYTQPLEEENWEDEIDPYAYERWLVKPEDRGAYDEMRKPDCDFYERKVEERVAQTRMVDEEERRMKREELERQTRREKESVAPKCESKTSGKSLVQLYHEKQAAKKREEEKLNAKENKGYSGEDLSDNEPPSPDSGFAGSIGSVCRSSQEENNEGKEHSSAKKGHQLNGSSDLKDIIWVGVKKKADPVLPNEQLVVGTKEEEDAFPGAWERRQELKAKKKDRLRNDKDRDNQKKETYTAGAGWHSLEDNESSVENLYRKEKEVSGLSHTYQEIPTDTNKQAKTILSDSRKPFVKAPPLNFSKKTKSHDRSTQPSKFVHDSILGFKSTNKSNLNASSTKEKSFSSNCDNSFNLQSAETKQNYSKSAEPGLNTADNDPPQSLKETIKSVYKSAQSLLKNSSEP